MNTLNIIAAFVATCGSHKGIICRVDKAIGKSNRQIFNGTLEYAEIKAIGRLLISIR
tara:strand:- start:480 stop:650 length:171 start_codon:yes stop_codon:yes gene_type:complete